MRQEFDFTVTRLGECRYKSPVMLSKRIGDLVANYVRDDEYLIFDTTIHPGETITFKKEQLIEKAGPREHIYFDPTAVHAAIVTCGGLCPGLNDVIRSIVMSLWYQYGVRRISGVRYGYRGFMPEYSDPFMELTPEKVSYIHRMGGTILGSSRGHGQRTGEIVDSLERNGINMLFTIGGDGTQKGSLSIAEEARRRGLEISIMGIPKTIDNDLSFIQKSFGFETAVSEAVKAVHGAHVEAYDAPNGVGLVKLMGRESGFISAYTALASNDVNFVLIPEVPFDLEGEKGLLNQIRNRLERRSHALIVVAEGAGQDHLKAATQKDASGNIKLGDIGVFLKDRIKGYFDTLGWDINLKYIDPSYIIRSTPANPIDSVYCTRLGTNAVHAAMAGRSEMLISLVNNNFVHIPITLAVAERNRIDPESPLWRDVIETTGQPPLMKNVS
ncbi:ATP-dependent 6-phosphofructokinase [Chitinispirillales bacterium ANBcel5]|uniref:ATP-dependent 6-phosphofructokinase n=1 Tax=Cellulosispirillum alkaliphilum TaxID=3039283 RepID=UPI002A535E94|nr:ATP-dependent 6-phosphofructokinase [Chitinispirillales bacterium ANBcel5]